MHPLEAEPIHQLSIKNIGRSDREDDSYDENDEKRTLACLDTDCIMLAIYKRDLELILYEVDINAENEGEILNNIQYIDLDDCWMRNYDDKDLPFQDEALITDMRFKNDGKMLRLCVNPGDQPYFFDIDLLDYTPTFEKCKQFEDKSILKYGAKFQKDIDPLERFIQEHVDMGAEFAFPEKDPKTICILDR